MSQDAVGFQCGMWDFPSVGITNTWCVSDSRNELKITIHVNKTNSCGTFL